MVKLPYVPVTALPTFALPNIVDDSGTAPTPLILKTELASSLSVSLLKTLPVASASPAVILPVSFTATGAAFTEIVIVRSLLPTSEPS